MNSMARMEARWADPEIDCFSDYSDSGFGGEYKKRAPMSTARALNAKFYASLRTPEPANIIDEKGGEVK